MKTPDEIKKGLEYLSIKCIVKKLDMWKEGIANDYAEDAAADALAYIKQLEAEKAELMEDNGHDTATVKYGGEMKQFYCEELIKGSEGALPIIMKQINDALRVPKGKAMLSQPMGGKSEQEIVETRNKAIDVLEYMGYEVVNTLFTDEWYSVENMERRGVVQVPLCYLAKSLENMCLCNAVYFCKGWEKARGCRIEHEAAVAYGLCVIYEE